MTHWDTTPKAIAFLIPSLRTGGAERVCALLANHWAARGHQVTVMTFEDAGDDAFELVPQIERVIVGQSTLTSTVWRTLKKNIARVSFVRRQLRNRKVDVAVSFMSPANVCLALAALGSLTAAIGTERTFPPAIPLGPLRERLRWVLYGLLDHVVAQTRDSADWLRHNTRAQAVSAIPNPLVLPLTTRQPVVAPHDWLRPGNRLVLAFGRLSVEKQFDQLVSAFCHASEHMTGWQLVILGDGPMREQLHETVRRNGLGNLVALPGAVGNVADWLQVASIYALTSAFEGYPNSLLEALASGVPAVAYDCRTGPRELIIDGVNGFLVPPNSLGNLAARLTTLMNDEPLRRRFAERAKSTADSHSLAQIAPQWEEVFNSALLGRRGRLGSKTKPTWGRRTALHQHSQMNSKNFGHTSMNTDHQTDIATGNRFAFGENWSRFLTRLDDDRIRLAEQSLCTMLKLENLQGKRFLDIGSGSGLFSLAARRLGATVVSFDYDPMSVACTEELRRRYYPDDAQWTVQRGSVLDPSYVASLGIFDVVYSWGVLHHTGQMYDAFANAVTATAPGSKLFVAIYNDQGAISKYWLWVKRKYNRSKLMRVALIGWHAPYLIGLRWLARALTGRLALQRGMSPWPDMIDWLGGYPFEVAKPEQVFRFFRERGFELDEMQTCGGRMGCNELVFTRTK